MEKVLDKYHDLSKRLAKLAEGSYLVSITTEDLREIKRNRAHSCKEV